MPAILYGSEAWCLKESETGILRRTERSMVRAMCGVHLKDRKRSTDLMFMLGYVIQATNSYWGYYQILNIGVSLSHALI